MKRLSPFYWIGRARKQFEDYIYELALRNFGEIKAEGTTEMTEKTQKLKPCPLCGCADIIIHKPTYQDLTLFSITCDDCDVRIKRFNEPEVVAAWNRRALTGG